MIRTHFLAALLAGLLAGPITAQARDVDPVYVRSVDAWHAQRMADLHSDTGALSQVGLHRLPEGRWAVGSATEADIVLYERAPARLGVITVSGDDVTFTADESVDVVIADSRPPRRVETVPLPGDATGSSTVLAVDSILFHVVRRDGVPLLRVRDRHSDALAELPEIERFTVDARYRVTAKLIPEADATLTLALEGGLTATSPSPGLLEFELDGQQHRLRPTADAGGALFIVFADATTGTETYPGGRYLATEPVGPDGFVVLDFNRAYTPVCAFNAYSTCPRPPPGNTLNIPIRAGEKFEREH